MQARIILNRDAGTLAALGSLGAGRVVRRFAENGVHAEAAWIRGHQASAAVHEALHTPGTDLVVVGGGDGTLSAAAAAMVGAAQPLAALPLGTLNHFARDLGVPADLDRAVDAIAKAPVRRIDVGELNGRVFLNNSSLGLYPDVLVFRDADRVASGSGKWTAFAKAVPRVLRRFPLLDLRIATSRRVFVRRTPFLVVGNNDYRLRFPVSPYRETLDDGTLSLYIARCDQPLDLARLAARAALSSLEPADDLEVEHSPVVLIVPSQPRVRVSLDGEVLRVAGPLRFRVLPKALRVIAPRDTVAGARPDAGRRQSRGRRGPAQQQADW